MNTIAGILRINEAELQSGIALNLNASWHAKFLKSAWCYVGNLPTQLTEGDVICVLSQFGEIEDVNLVRDEETGKSRGFAFVKYEDSRSCVLAVDNLCGVKILDRTVRVDHVEKYRLPKRLAEKEEKNKEEDEDVELSRYRRDDDRTGKKATADDATAAGHAYRDQELQSSFDIHAGQDLFVKPEDTKTTRSKEQKVTSRKENDEVKSEGEKKRLRKEARDAVRRERRIKREKKEERRRKKRARKLRHEERDTRDYNVSSDGSSRNSSSSSGRMKRRRPERERDLSR